MKRTIYFLLLLSFVFNQDLVSQTKKLSLKDAVIGQYMELSPRDIEKLQWIPGSNRYSFVENDILKESQNESKEISKIISLDEINQLTGSSENDTKISRFPSITWINSNIVRFKHQNRWLKVNPFRKQLIASVQINEAAENEDYCKASDYFAYTIKNDLFITSFDGETTRITNEENNDIVYGQEVHRREFGINKGTFWSPSGKKLAFYRKDESMVTDFPLVDISTRVAKYKPIKYPMAGMKSHQVKVGVYDLKNQRTIYLDTGNPPDKYLTNIQWGPKGKYIYIAVLNRDQNHMKLNQYNAKNGALIKTLFEEKHEKYVEPLHPVKFLPGKEIFVWRSRRDGYNHLYLYNIQGKLIKQLTKGQWEVTGDFLHFDASGNNIFFLSTKESPIERHIHKVNIRSGKITRLTSQPGYHNPRAGGKKTYIIDEFSSTEVPRIIQIIDNKGQITKKLLEAKDPLKDYNLGKMEISTIKAADDKTDLYYRLITPPDFDPQKKYPAIVYVYGGPHAQLVQNRWLGSARMWQFYMAQKGYVMLTVDNRGSAARGLEFENVIHRQLGEKELLDQMEGVKMLKRLSYVDTNRIGVHGWSYGGFMTTTMMLKKPDVFKTGVAGGPVIDWKYYEVMYGERYMDTPQKNQQGYQNANLKNYVTNLEGKLLIIQGYMDDIVVKQHSLSFIRKCVKQNVQVDYFIYPGHKHNVRGSDRLHLMRKITQYFEAYL
jgi:dipeptidyl-peptidase-4